MRHNTSLGVFTLCLLVLFVAQTPAYAQQDQVPANPMTLIRLGQGQKKAVKVNEAINQAIGFGNTFLVTTSETKRKLAAAKK